MVPRARDGLDPATRTFQALRMLVNEELDELAALARSSSPSVLADGGVAAVISFHSLEDRAVKQAFAAAARGCVCPPRIPTVRVRPCAAREGADPAGRAAERGRS